MAKIHWKNVFQPRKKGWKEVGRLEEKNKSSSNLEKGWKEGWKVGSGEFTLENTSYSCEFFQPSNLLL